jgi:hypothetical protein
MKKEFNSNLYSFFVLVGEGLAKINRGGTFSFSSYADRAGVFGDPGSTVMYVVSKDAKGDPKGKYFSWNESHRKFQVRDGEKSINGISQYNFLKNAPECEGSPNGRYTPGGEQAGVMYREMNTTKDAEVALQADEGRITAQQTAFNLDTETLAEVAAYIGVFASDEDPDGTIMKVRVVDWAGKHPNDFSKTLNSGDRHIRALIRKAVSDGTFDKRGEIIYWNTSMLGPDEDAVVKSVLEDKLLFSTLKDKIKLVSEKKKKK